MSLAPGSHSIEVCALKTVNSVLYSSTRTSFNFEVLPKVAQTITASNPGSVFLSNESFTLGASADSELELEYLSLTPLVCTVDPSGVVQTLEAGECTIKLSQGGNAQFLAANDSTIDFNIVRPVPTALTAVKWKIVNLQGKLTWSAPSNKALANIKSYVVKWRIALKGKSFGSWKTKTVYSAFWVSPKYAKWTKVQVKIYAVGETGNSPTVSSSTTIK